jgi:hypothetical protein
VTPLTNLGAVEQMLFHLGRVRRGAGGRLNNPIMPVFDLLEPAAALVYSRPAEYPPRAADAGLAEIGR